ncbi:MAG: TPM domain-containing protein [Acutalibacteraceae bacterium]
MKKRIFSALLALIICFATVVSGFAIVERNLHIIDYGCILDDSQFNELEDYATELQEEYGYYVMYCLTDTVGDIGTYEYCKQIFQQYAVTDDGLVLTHNTGDNLYSLYVVGEAEKLFDEEEQEKVCAAYNETETYYDGIKAYLGAVEKKLKASGASAKDSGSQETAGSVTVDPNLPTERLQPLVVDSAGLLTDTQVKELEQTLTVLSQKYQLDVAVVTASDLAGKTAEEYADDFYDYNGYGQGENADGLLLLYKPGAEGERKLQISTCGKAIEFFPDWAINNILNAVKEKIIDGDYAGAFAAFAKQCEARLEDELGPPSVDLIWIPICLVFGFLISLMIMKKKAASVKSVRSKMNAADYTGNIAVTGRTDRFLYRNVNKTPIPKDDTSSGSSTHTSSSGRSHGGGGIDF